MKSITLSIFLVFSLALSAFCGGNLELVNTQEMRLDNINNVRIIYSSEKVSIYMGTTDALVIKEYMNENNNKYFAKINEAGSTLTIENGDRPFRPIFNFFNRRLEVYLPVSYKNAISVKTSSGDIDTSDMYCSDIYIESSSGKISARSITSNKVNLKSSSGRIDVGSINGNIILMAKSGNIIFGAINGSISAETSSGDIELGIVTGAVNAKTSSGKINCTVNENAGDITLYTSSGAVRLYLPRNISCNFSSRTSSGRLTTPFSDRLSIPVNDRNLTQGIIRNNDGSNNISKVDITTSSGSINVEWK